jgi:5,5'-dehydrodivanillate O-demethylase
MISKEENERLTRVGRGTPGGEMLRRYWWPVAFADEIKGPRPKKIRLLGEDFVLFRDGAGRLGLLESHCAHRRTAMQYGRVERDGIRCCYHGWLWDAAGRCLETPCEEPGSTLKDRVSMAAYAVQDVAGLVFAYIGPKPAPLLPRYDLLVHRVGIRYVWGFTDHCNWLQSMEQAADPHHLCWLHAGPYPMYAGKRAQVELHNREYGFDYALRVAGVDGDNSGSVVFPSYNRFTSGRRVKDGIAPRNNMLFRTPEDDTKTLNFFISIYPSEDGKFHEKTEAPPDKPVRGPWLPTERGVYPPGDEEWWGVHQMAQDRMALENQGPICDRSTEHLGGSDRAVVMYRTLLRNSIDAVAEGKDPMGIIRDPARNPVINFGTHLHGLSAPIETLAGQDAR